MTDELLRKPRKKRYGRHAISPFPVPIESITGTLADDCRWYYYFGVLKSDHVAVYRKADLTYLYILGFFGKGMLSKSHPQFESCSESSLENTKTNQRILSLNLAVKEKRLIKERLRQHSVWEAKRKETSLQDVKDAKLEDKGCVANDVCVDDVAELLQGDMMTDGEDSLDEEDSVHEHLSTPSEDAGIVGEKRSLSPQQETNCKMWKLEDSYKVFEKLQLTYEEAFFLSYGLGCLSVDDQNSIGMNVQDMWSTYMERKHDFLYMYAAYHHFRSKGWVVRLSNMFGADFVLYQDGMPFYHASYAVFVKFIDKDLEESNSSFSWKELGCICRVNEKIAKEVLLCYVIKPKGLTREEIKSPSCIKKFDILETIVRRWLPEKHRDVLVY